MFAHVHKGNRRVRLGKLTGSGIGHGKKKGLLMLLREGLVVELVAIDRLAACAITSCEVTTLNHELLDDSVEDGALVVEGFPRLSNALLTGAKSTEVLGSLGDKVGVEFHGDATSGLAADRDIEEDAGSSGGLALRRHCKDCKRGV